MSVLPSLSRRAVPALVALVLALAALVVAGCGGGGGGGDENADPAKIAPRNTLMWFAGQIRPEGDQKDAVDAIAKKVLGVDDPGKRIQDLLNKSIRESGSKMTYEDDIEPWLGRRAGVAVTGLDMSGGDSQAVAIVAAKDTDKAKDAINKLGDEETPKAPKREYQGVEYRFDTSDRAAAGVVDDYVVVGTEAAFKAAVDASKKEVLSDNRQYAAAAKDAEDDLGFGFVNTRGLLAVASAQGTFPGQSLEQVFPAAGQPVTMTLNAKPESLTLEAVSGLTPQARRARPNALVPELPGDAWLAIGVPNVGQLLRQTLEQLGGGVGAGTLEAAQQQIRAVTGLDLTRDIIPSLGELALFAEGSSILTLGGAIVIQTPEPAAARRLLDRLQPLIARQAEGAVTVSDANVAGARGIKITSPEIPGAINAVLRGDRLVIAYTDAATRRALSPDETLGDSPQFQQATASLGGAQPALYVAVAPIVQLAAAASPEDAPEIRRYLGAFSTLVAGGRVRGNKQVGRFVLNLK